MYQVVIVDDEEIIARGLEMLLPWAKYNCRVAGTASSGEEGLKLIRTLRPEILITDIRMPGMDGLTMVAALRSEMPRLQITVLTGFRDFEYAQTAVKLGVDRFLLKPSKMDELQEALVYMTGRLDALPPAAEPAQESDPEDEEAVSAAVALEDSRPESEAEEASRSFLVDNAIAYIREHYAEKLTLQDVADHIYVSQWHLSKLLKKQANTSFYDLLNGARIQAAKELLLDPSIKVGDVSKAVGFSDNAHFAKIFKKLEGCSANDYRSSVLGTPKELS